MILIFLLLLVTSSQACVNSCCQSCAPDQCQACYKLNNNPVMCPCLEEIGDSRGETFTIQQETSNQYAETIKDVNLEKDLPRLSKFQSSSRKSQFSILGGSTVGKLVQSSVKTKLFVLLGQCRPSCCKASCTPTTCPLCYRLSVTSPRTCPCR